MRTGAGIGHHLEEWASEAVASGSLRADHPLRALPVYAVEMLTVARRLLPDELDLPAPELMTCTLGADVVSIGDVAVALSSARDGALAHLLSVDAALASITARWPSNDRDKKRGLGGCKGYREAGMTMLSGIEQADVRAIVAEVLNRRPVAGLTVAVVHRGTPVWLYTHGIADVERGVPVDEDTVFRIGSITKTMTAIAVMQLAEQGLLDLDAPVEGYLRSFRLLPADAGFRPVTIRHLLTHTAGVRAVRSATDLVRPALGWGSPAGLAVPSLAEYYGPGLHVDAEPGTRFAYSNNGFAVLGQVVEDISGMPFDRYLREQVFDPLGMEHSDVVRSDRVRRRLAIGYEPGRRGLTRVADLEVVALGAGSVYSSTRDMVRYVTALLSGGAGEHGTVLEPETLAMMFQPHFQPDERLPGIGLAFFRDTVGGHRIVAHDGIWKGFLSTMLLAPDDSIGVLALANTGHFRPGGAPDEAAEAVLRRLLDVPPDEVSREVPQHPAVWGDFCGTYSLGRGVLVDPQPRSLFGAGLQVRAGDRLTVGVPLVPWRLTLHPQPGDHDAFRVDPSRLVGGTAGTMPVVFGRDKSGRVSAMHLQLGRHPMTFTKRLDKPRPGRLFSDRVTAGAAALRREHHR